MAAVSWQISSDGNLDLAPNKNVLFCLFEVIKIKWKKSGWVFCLGYFWGFFWFSVLGGLGGTLVSVFSLRTAQLPPPPIIALLGKKKPTPKWIFLLC